MLGEIEAQLHTLRTQDDITPAIEALLEHARRTAEDLAARLEGLPEGPDPAMQVRRMFYAEAAQAISACCEALVSLTCTRALREITVARAAKRPRPVRLAVAGNENQPVPLKVKR